MPREAITPNLSDFMRLRLEEIESSRSLPHFLVQRAKIILLAAASKGNSDIAKIIGRHQNTVARWRSRFLEMLPTLETIEAEHPDKFGEELVKVLRDKKRPGAPSDYTADQRAFIITVACHNPADYGFELSHWNYSCLRLAVIQKGIVEKISVSQLKRILDENEVRPHKHQYWLHSAEKAEDPEAYKTKVKAINNAYALARQLSELDIEPDTRIISTDEMTGVQALERKYPDKPTAPGMYRKQEFEYIRHGTVSLTAFLDVVSGKIADPYLNATRTELDFVSAIDTLLTNAPDKKWIIIADNLNTHYSASLVEYVARRLDYNGDLGKKGKSGILKSKETRKAFLSDDSHKIYFLYTPKHCSWLNQIEIWFGILNRQLLKRNSYLSVEVLVQSILRFIEQYNRLFAHPFNWKYATTPLGD